MSTGRAALLGRLGEYLVVARWSLPQVNADGLEAAEDDEGLVG